MLNVADTAGADADAADPIGPLVVRPSTAMRILDCGRTRLYQLIDAGELASFLDGSARKITMASLRAYVARKVAAAAAAEVPEKSRRPPDRPRGGRGTRARAAA